MKILALVLRLVLPLVLLLAGIAAADPAKKPCDPFSSVHGCDDKADAPAAKRAFVKKPVMHEAPALVAQADPPATPPVGSAAAPAAAPAPDERKPGLKAMRQTCVDAMNADPVFAASVVATADKQIDQKTIDAHKDALAHIQKNEKHVIYAYAAMWVIAALLVAFLFLRQQALKAELASLRRDLKAAEDKA